MKNNFSRILWGVGLLAAAVLLVVSQLGLLSFKIGFWMIILTVIFVACLIAVSMFQFSQLPFW